MEEGGKLLCGFAWCNNTVSNDYSTLIPLSVNVITRAQARMNESTNGQDSNGVGLHSSNGNTNAEIQTSAVSDLTVCSDAQGSMDTMLAVANDSMSDNYCLRASAGVDN